MYKHPLTDREAEEIAEAYLSFFESVGDGHVAGPESALPHPSILISAAILRVLRSCDSGDMKDRLWEAFIGLESFLPDKDWGIVSELENRVSEGPDAILAMDGDKMKAANRITREIGERKLLRMEILRKVDWPDC